MRALTLALLAAAACLACELAPKKPEDYGLPVVELTIDSENLAKLNGTVWAKVPFAGVFAMRGQRLKAQISYSGKSTIDAYKKSFELAFADGGRYLGRSTYRLSSQPADPSALKSMIGYPVFAAVGLLTPAVEPAVLYLNGRFQGLYFLIEPIDPEFFKVRGITASNLVKALYGNARFDETTDLDPEGAFDAKIDPEFYGDLKRLIETVLAPASEDNQRALARQLDLESTLRYVAAAVLLNHWDGFKNNIFLYREASSSTFRLVPWDLDRLYDESSGHGIYQPGKSLYGEGGLAAKLLSYPDLRQRYHAILWDLLKQTMPYAKLAGLIDGSAARIAAAFQADRVLSARGRTAVDEAAHLKGIAAQWYQKVEEDLAKQDPDHRP